MKTDAIFLAAIMAATITMASSAQNATDSYDLDIAVPSFVKRSANTIKLNGADWSSLRRLVGESDDAPVSIVHIGDSHIQAGIGTRVTRDLLQYDYGDAGRGVIAPLKLAGTNEPADYYFTSDDSWESVKLLGKTWAYPMGFTGVSLHPAKKSGSFRLSTITSADDFNPFTSVTLFHGGKLTIDSVIGAERQRVETHTFPSRDYTQLILNSPQADITIYFTSAGDFTLYGASLSGDNPGFFYHSIGNNGAMYASYNRIGNVGYGIAPLKPALVILSLGTNEAFSNTFNSAEFYESIDRLVKNIVYSNPNAKILLVTPMEAQRAVSKTVTKKVKQKGRKGTVNKKQTVTSYEPHPNIVTVREQIMRYGKEKGVAVLDWYEVAGGKGASTTWVNKSLMGKDRVHLTNEGYRLSGRLMYEALIEAFVQ